MSRYIDTGKFEILDDDNTVASVHVVDTRHIGGRVTVRVSISNEDGMGGPSWHAGAEQIDLLIESLERAKEELLA